MPPIADFDLRSRWGPAAGVNRLVRWHRAERLRLNPPAVVKMLLDRHAASDPAVLRSVLDGPLGLLRGGSRRQQAVV